MNKHKKIKVIEGGAVKDKLGVIKFINGFNFNGVKRFYQIDFSTKGMVRAFHGHLKEAKYVYLVEGNALLCLVKLSSAINPSKKAKVYKYKLTDKKPLIVQIPAGFANGIKSLSANAKVIFFSTSSLSNSLKDDFRFPSDYWGKDIWKNNGI